MRYAYRGASGRQPGRSSAAAAAGLLLAALVLAGCEERPPPQTGPEPTDSLVKLMRHQLTAEDPVAVEEKILCEIKRLRRAMGRDSAWQRMEQAADTAFGPSDEPMRRRVDSALDNKVFGVPEDCDLPGDSTTAVDSTAAAPEGADSSADDTSGNDALNPRR